MAAFVNSFAALRGLDEDAISVPCRMAGCEKRIYRDVRCREHGGDPDYEWSTSEWGETTYLTRPEAQEGQTR